MAVEGGAVTGVATPLVPAPGGIGDGGGTTTPPSTPAGPVQLIIDPGSDEYVLLNQTNPDAGIGLTAHTFTGPAWTRIAASGLETEGDLPFAVHPENRQISLRFEIHGTSQTDTATRMRRLEAKIAKLADPNQGGTLRWTQPNGLSVTFEITGVDSYDPVFDDGNGYSLYYEHAIVQVSLVLIAKPYALGDPKVVVTKTETSLPVLIADIPEVGGSAPALLTINVTNQGVDKRTVWYGIENEHYDPAVTAPLFYQAETSKRWTGSVVSDPGASSGQVTSHAIPSLATVDTISPGLSAANIALPHVGMYRVFARANALHPASLRMVWWPSYISDSTPAQFNSWVPFQLPPSSYEVLDLGLVDADGDLSGWALIVEARDTNTTGVANRVLMDCLWLVPAELYGRVAMNTAPFTSATITDSSVIVIHTSGAKMRPSQHDGDYPSVPPSGASRLILKASSASVSSQQDSSIDDVSINVVATPRFLTVPTA
jgi:hypothetical protein